MKWKFNGDLGFFVQGGAFEGGGEDPVANHLDLNEWAGIMVKLHPVYFGRLKGKYGSRPSLEFLNLAISNHIGYTDLHYMPEGKSHSWTRQISKIDPTKVANQ